MGEKWGRGGGVGGGGRNILVLVDGWLAGWLAGSLTARLVVSDASELRSGVKVEVAVLSK